MLKGRWVPLKEGHKQMDVIVPYCKNCDSYNIGD